MSDKITKSPQIRFAGFTDAWEQWKLGDMLKEFSIKTKTENEYPVLSSTNSGMEIRNGRVSGTSNLGYKIIEDGDLVLSPQNLWLGNINVNDIGKGLVSPSYKTFKFVDLDSQFIEPQLRLPRMMEEYKNASTQGASVVRRNLELESFYQIPIRVPSWKEQKKIGSFSKQLDDTITLHQRELELLKDTKKSLLQKMFPKDGSNVPEIRFAGFTDAWEQRRLGELYIERKERGDDSLQILSVSIHHGVSNEELDSNTLGKKVRRSEDKSLYKHVYYGDLVLNMMRAWQGSIGVVKSEGMVSPAYITATPSSELYPLFMDYCLRRVETISQIDNLSYGVTDFRKRLYWDSFINVICEIPSIPEQKMITDFFTHLDNLITLHQRELNSLKNLKKSLLQQMFI
ncbi:type I restriction enzyme S subunit [Paenibacillus sp. PvR133]|uniref:restriction endonuclease subunit S n=1 Tax=Paenibacillus sp. PvR133 TaxID=2806598 RepID=UPI001AE6FAA2|nr:restriction endonuclease subunit S [Paenibacillus sp. PvR133]MBP1174742.1 type I restriction enzyme S subunit [Paenibacillus sp. PvR133]